MLTSENTWRDVERSASKIAVVPVGATEQHGTNLPLCTDSVFTQGIAEAIAQATGAYLVPLLPFGQSDDWLEFPGTISLSAETMRAVVADVVRSLATTGFQWIFLLSVHGGNDVLWSGYLEQLAARYSGVKVRNVDLVPAFQEAARVSGLPFPNHADETEASAMLWLRPNLVGPEPTDCPAPPGGYPKGKTERQVSPGGSLGEPSKACRAKGEAAWKALVACAVDAVLQELKR